MSAIKDDAVYNEIKRDWLERGLVEGEDFVDFGIKADARMPEGFVDFREVEPVSFDRRTLHRLRAVMLNRGIQGVIPSFDMKYSAIPETVLIPSLDFPITTFCSLQCKYCSHAIPHVKKPRHFSPEDVAADLDKLLSACRIGSLHLMGGEALLHPQLTETVHLLSKMDNKHNLSIVQLFTNGTIMPSDEVMRTFTQLDNVLFHINNYGEKSRAINGLEKKCREFKIPYTISPNSDSWVDLGNIEERRNYSESELITLFAICSAALCTRLHDGKLYLCTRHAVLNEERLIPYDETTFVDVRDFSEDALREKLAKFFYSTESISGCQYCDGLYMGAKKVLSGT